jgi:drug/metabolite transporter (DMT)-like permease
MLLLANLFWGLSFPLIKAVGATQALLLPHSSSWFITACTLLPRFLLGALILGAIGFRTLRTTTAGEFRQAATLGLFAVGGMILQIDGLQYTSASTSAFLTQFYAIMIPVWVAIRRRRQLPWTVWVSGALVLAGVAVLAELDWRDLRLGRGELETLASSVFFMGQILWLDRAEFAANRPLPVTIVMFAVEAAAATVFAFVTAPDAAALRVLPASAPWVAFTLGLTVFCTLGAFTLMNTWQPKITATEAGLLYCVEPVFASILALFLPAWFSAWGGFDYPNEVATAHLIIGGGLITVANVLIQLKPPAKT